MLRALFTGSMAGLQVPAGMLAERIGGPLVLGLGTALVGVGFLAAGASAGYRHAGGGAGAGRDRRRRAAPDRGPPRRAGVFRDGARAPRSPATISPAISARWRFRPLTAGLVALMPWQSATLLLGVFALAAAAVILSVRGLPGRDSAAGRRRRENCRDRTAAASGRGFPLLLSIAMIDSATRMGFLTFLPFLLKLKGADLPTIGIALTLVFTGGAAGKLVCGWLGARLGVLKAVFLTEGLTAAGIVALLPLPLFGALLVLPLIGVALNGTSSVLYGTVPELVPPERRQRAFGIFYTGGIGAGALSPVLYGLVSDLIDVPVMMMLIAAVVLLTLPLTWGLRPALRAIAAAHRSLTTGADRSPAAGHAETAVAAPAIRALSECRSIEQIPGSLVRGEAGR